MELKSCKKTTDINKICNEKTGRNVFITGKIGKKILLQKMLLRKKVKVPSTKSPKISKAYKDVNKTSFQGSTLNIMAGLLYLMYRHNNACVVIPYNKKHIPTTTDDFTCNGIKYNNTDYNGVKSIEHTPSFWNNFKRCYSDTSSRFIIFHLTIYFNDTNSAHSNYMIYDKDNKSLERFDPNGTAIKVSKQIDSNIKYLYNKKIDCPAFILK